MDAVHLVRPGHSILRDHPLPVPDLRRLLDLGELPLSLSKPSVGVVALGDLLFQPFVRGGEFGRSPSNPVFQLGGSALQVFTSARSFGHQSGEEQ